MQAKSNSTLGEASRCSVDYYATVQNQYGLLLGDGFGATEGEAIIIAKKRADEKIQSSNPNWRWRKAKVRCGPNPLIGGWADAAPCTWCGNTVRSYNNAPGAYKADHKPDCAWLGTVAAKSSNSRTGRR